MKDSVKTDEKGLARRLGLLSTTLAGVGVILGSGIYVIVGIAAGSAGNAVWLAFLIAALVAGLTALSYARLGRLKPKNAPEYHFVNSAFGEFFGFSAGWLILWAGVISSSAVALGFAGYLNHLLSVPLLAGALGLIALCTLIIFLGVGESATVAGTLTLIEVLGLIFIIAIGIPHLGSVDYLEMPRGAAGLISTASLVFFAYLGFEGMANLTEEMENPERDLPRAILLALIISTLLYILVSVTAVSVLGWQALVSSEAPLAVVAGRVLGNQADLVLTIIGLGSTANTVLVLVLAVSRGVWGMSCSGMLPGAFCIIGEKRRTPWVAVISVGLTSGLFVFARKIESVAELTNFTTLIAFAGVNASVMRLFAREQGSRYRHLWLNRILPSLGVATSVFLAFNTGIMAIVFGLVIFVAALPAYFILRRILRRKT